MGAAARLNARRKAISTAQIRRGIARSLALADCRSKAFRLLLSCRALAMPTIREKTQLMSGPEIDRTLTRLAHEIIEKNDSLENLTLIGVRRRGVPLANRLAEKIAQVGQQKIPVGVLDITFYRDDLSTVGQKPVVQPPKIECPITDRDVILVDDVLYTGRT
ncbi:MAG: bifunctional pyr operon transcriptional regulator/uracil phosphoribosyltransferase PyrR, partial [Gammaproteobacteria bacterium]